MNNQIIACPTISQIPLDGDHCLWIARFRAADVDAIDGRGEPGKGVLRDLFSGETQRVRLASDHYLTVFPCGTGLVRQLKKAVEQRAYTHPEVALAMRIFIRRSLGVVEDIEALPKLAKRGMPRAFSDRVVFHLEGGPQIPQNKMVARHIWSLYDALVKVVSDEVVRRAIYSAPPTGRDHVPYVQVNAFMIDAPASESDNGLKAVALGAAGQVWRLLRRCGGPGKEFFIGSVLAILTGGAVGAGLAASVSGAWRVAAGCAVLAGALLWASWSASAESSGHCSAAVA